MKKKYWVIVLMVLILAVGYGLYQYYRPHQSIAGQAPVANIEAVALAADFESDENAANTKYLGKVIEVNGVVSENTMDSTGQQNMTLKGTDLSAISCQFEKGYTAGRSKGDTVKIKGVCTGFLMDVILVDCVISGNSRNE